MPLLCLYLLLMRTSAHLNTNLEVLRIWALLRFQLIVMRWITVQLGRISVCPVFCPYDKHNITFYQHVLSYNPKERLPPSLSFLLPEILSRSIEL